MINTIRNEYYPDTVSAPGETLLETLEERGLTQTELAQRMGRPIKTINEIIKGKAEITPETALQLERVLGISAGFWNRREARYREYLARVAEEGRLQEYQGWLEELPLADMIRRRWVRRCATAVEQVRELLNFFGVASPKAWHELCHGAAYRNTKAFQSNPASVAAWLRQGELEARKIDCEPFNERRFRETLPKLRALTVEGAKVFGPELVRLSAACGVAVVLVPELPGTRLCGATRWLTPEKALIQLSLRYKTDDHLWFTFFHEAGHILLHGKRDFFVDVEGNQTQDEKEEQANRFAADLLLPPFLYDPFRRAGVFTAAAIRRLAEESGIAPGIVVGRLQHDGLLGWRSACNDLKVRFRILENEL